MSDEKDLPPKMRASAQAAPPKPLPRPQDPVEQEFWNRCQDGNLFFQQCEGCGSFRHLPRYMCARCGSPEWSWERSSGKGTLFSWTVTHQALHPAFAAEIPFIAAVVELEEGVRMATRLIDCAHDELTLDLPVTLDFEPISDDFRLPVFRPARTASAQG
ncbi:OB-fold domain-containing protein [uncultured Sphingopyxis sp.]|uniref:Zn-ribbon domain-containing OB-fold protein n=1 Tax=uncultured Sphingopyxis sp. TaxID=310581 RepID=UPI000B2BE1AD|nr:OB-fold domain-containing protein [uncultured Sphingopyxis sp.]